MKDNISVPSNICDEAHAFINNLTTLLKEQAIMTSLDESALLLLAYTYDNYIKATRVIQEKGLTLESPRGESKARPEVKIQIDSLVQINKIMDSFGLSPKARKEISKPKEKVSKKSPIEEFIQSSKIKVNGKVRSSIHS
jgi:P27 family predicted phage terminase small subunit